jgi:hypothetical protein
MLQCTITRHGVPIGSIDIAEAVSVVTAEFTPLPVFSPWRRLAAAVGEALRSTGLFGQEPMVTSSIASDRRTAALDEGASWGRDLELRDRSGTLIATSFIEIAEVPGEDPLFYVAWIGFRAGGTGIPATLERPRRALLEEEAL